MAGAPINRDTEENLWYHGNNTDDRFEFFTLSRVEFDLRQLRAALSGYYWDQNENDRATQQKECHEIPVLRGTDNTLQTFLESVEGNPLLIALAVLWFAKDPSRSIAKLKESAATEEEKSLFPDGSNIKALVAHRLIKDRIEELINDLREMEGKKNVFNHGLLRALACATVADGFSLKAAEFEFKVNLDQKDLHRLFPEQSSNIVALPPRRPWSIGEVFFAKVENLCFPNNAEKRSQLIATAFADNPAGVLKALSRTGHLATIIAATLQDLPTPQQAEEQLSHYTAFAQGALYGHTEFLQHTLDLLGFIEGQNLVKAQDNLLRIINIAPHPNAIVAITLYCRIAQRWLPEQTDSVEAIRQTLAWMNEWLTHIVPPKTDHPLAAPFLSAFGILANTVYQHCRFT